MSDLKTITPTEFQMPPYLFSVNQWRESVINFMACTFFVFPGMPLIPELFTLDNPEPKRHD